jgi:uncharacterized repeat protein (TIGR02543 family)
MKKAAICEGAKKWSVALLIACLVLAQTSPVLAENNAVVSDSAQATQGLSQDLETPILPDTALTIDAEHFPDEDFRAFVSKNYDLDQDGVLSEQECNAVEIMELGGGKIASLEGIEYFPNLIKLDCSYQNIRSLDVSQNTKLENLYCQANFSLKQLDVSANSQLKGLCCSQTGISNLDLSDNELLEWVECTGTSLSTLDLSGKTRLQTVRCSSNSNLTQLNLEGCYALQILDCYKCNLQTLDLSDLKNLSVLDCHSNMQMTDIIFPDALPNLTLATCDNNFALDALNIPDAPVLKTLGCANIGLAELDLSGMPQLETLSCYANELTALDTRYNPELMLLDCSANQLISLDLSQNPKLIELKCYDNQLTALDTSHNRALETIMCFDNQIASLDVSANVALKDLRCGENALASLNLAGNDALVSLDCNDQRVSVSVRKDANDSWTFDAATLVGQENAQQISNMQAIDGQVVSETAVQFAAPPTTENVIVYTYDTGAVNSAIGKQKMSVTLEPNAVCDVTFDAGNGEPPIVQTVAYNTAVEEPSAPERSGYLFDGWYNGSQKWDFSTPVADNMTLVAKWTPTSSATDSSSSDAGSTSSDSSAASNNSSASSLPQNTSPKTGDALNLAVLLLAVMGNGAVLTWLLHQKRKLKKD